MTGEENESSGHCASSIPHRGDLPYCTIYNAVPDSASSEHSSGVFKGYAAARTRRLLKSPSLAHHKPTVGESRLLYLLDLAAVTPKLHPPDLSLSDVTTCERLSQLLSEALLPEMKRGTSKRRVRIRSPDARVLTEAVKWSKTPLTAATLDSQDSQFLILPIGGIFLFGSDPKLSQLHRGSPPTGVPVQNFTKTAIRIAIFCASATAIGAAEVRTGHIFTDPMHQKEAFEAPAWFL